MDRTAEHTAENGEREGEFSTPFTVILRELVGSVQGSLGAIFIDGLGESVDYYSTIDPYDLKVMGACGALLVQMMEQTKLDPMALLGLSGTNLSLWIQPLGEHYTLLLVLERRTWAPDLETAMDAASRLIKKEAGIR